MTGEPPGGIDEVFVGPLQSYAGKLILEAGCDCVPVRRLIEGGGLSTLLARYHAVTGGDGRAACSFWSQLYFGTLVIPAVSILLLQRKPVALGIDDLHVVLCPERHVPLAFVRRAVDVSDLAGAFGSLLDGHLAPIVDALREAGRLSPRLLWENAGWPLAFALTEAVRRRPACSPEIGALFERAMGPPACHAALAQARDMALHGRPYARRLCCLRDRLPGLSRCAGLCPLDRAGEATRQFPSE